MRFVIYGAGAVGGAVGASLYKSGHDVMLIARGAHHDALVEQGLDFETPRGRDLLHVPSVGHPREVWWRAGDVVMLAMKTHDTAAALTQLVGLVPVSTPIVCLQNGVDSERQALRWFPNVYGVPVLCPADHLEPGSVRAYSHPVVGLFDIGRYPQGIDEMSLAIASALNASDCESVARNDIMRWKYRKLITNLANVIDAACAGGRSLGDVVEAVYAEGEAVLRAAGIDFVSRDDDMARRGSFALAEIPGRARHGSSTKQSVTKGGPVESHFLNGEIVLLGRLHGVATPLNEALLRIIDDTTARGLPAGHLSADDFRAALGM